MTDIIDMIILILPFVFGLIAISLIPGKEKILSKQVTNYRVEVLVVVYMIALLILSFCFYLFVPMFSDSSGIVLLDMFNGGLLSITGLGIMGLNYRNHSLVSKDLTHREERVSLGVEVEAAVVEDNSVEPELDSVTSTKKDIQMVECPQCSKAIKVDASQRPVKISCPHCGIEGMVQ